MMEISIEESTFKRLQHHAKPLVDTTDTILNRALDALDALDGESARPAEHEKTGKQIDPRRLPDLKHTKVIDARIDGKEIQRPNWNRLLDQVLILAMSGSTDYEDVRVLCPVNMVRGRKEDEGYSYLSEIDLSVQGQDSNAACRAIVTTARGLGIGMDIGFMWRPKDGAAHPGERARIVLNAVPGSNRTEAA